MKIKEDDNQQPQQPEKERITVFWECNQIEKKDFREYSLELASVSILPSLLHQTPCRDYILFDNEDLMKSIYFLAAYHNQIHLQFAALSFLWNALPYIKTNAVNDHNDDETSPFSVSFLSSTLLSILSARDLSDKSSYTNIGVETNVPIGYNNKIELMSLNPNLITIRALELLHELYFKIPSVDNPSSNIFQVVSLQLARLLEHTIATNQNKNKRRILFQTNSGRLACELTSLLLLIVGSKSSSLLLDDGDDDDKLKSSSCAVAAMMSLIINSNDSLKVDETEEWMFWNAATTNAIFFLSILMFQRGETTMVLEDAE